MNNSWRKIQLDVSRSKSNCYASVGHNRIGLNKRACELVNNWNDYLYAYVGTKENDEETLIGIEFSKSDDGYAYNLTRKQRTNKTGKNVPTGGLYISSKNLVMKIFGEEARGKTHQYKVTKDVDNSNMIVIHVPNSNNNLENISKNFFSKFRK